MGERFIFAHMLCFADPLLLAAFWRGVRMRQWRDNLSPKVAAVSAAVIGLGVALAVIAWRHGSQRDASSISAAQSPSFVSTSAFARPKAYPCPIAGDFKLVDIPVGLLLRTWD